MLPRNLWPKIVAYEVDAVINDRNELEIHDDHRSP